jgi:hypothetical protein
MRARLGRLPAMAWLIASLACSDVTEPARPDQAPAVAGLAQLVPPDAGGTIEDVLDRVLPALENEAGSQGLETALSALLDALARGKGAESLAAIEASERALEALVRDAAAGHGDAVHLDVIDLALASVRAGLATKR